MNLQKCRYPVARFFLLCCISIILLPACNKPSPGEKIMAQAAAFIAAGEYSAAESLYRNRLADGDDADTALALVDLYILWHRPQPGLEALDTALALGVRSTDTITQHLELLLQDQQWPVAAGKARVQTKTHPADFYSWQALTAAYLEMNQCKEARSTSESAWLADQDNQEAALIYSILNEDREVLCNVDAALCATVMACETFCYPEIGLNLVKRNRWAVANCILQHAESIEPENAGVHTWLGESYTRIGKPEAAERHFIKGVEIDPANPIGWVLLGTYAYKAGDWDIARAALLNAQRLDPENPVPCLGIAELKAAQGLYDEVDVWIGAALERAPNDIAIWKEAAQFYIRRNLVQSNLPRQIAEGAVRLNPQDAEAHLLLGWSYLLTGDTSTAIQEIDQAITLDASLGQAYYLKSVLLERLGNTEQAAEASIRAADLGFFP